MVARPVDILAVVLAIAVCGGPRSAAAEDRALLTGTGSYMNLPDKMTLHGPKNDVAAVKKLLTGKPTTGEGATSSLEAIEDILGHEDTGDVRLSLYPGQRLRQGTPSRLR